MVFGEKHKVINVQIDEMDQEMLRLEGAGKHPWYEIFTTRGMKYRIFLSISMLAFQQLSGANYFF